MVSLEFFKDKIPTENTGQEKNTTTITEGFVFINHLFLAASFLCPKTNCQEKQTVLYSRHCIALFSGNLFVSLEFLIFEKQNSNKKQRQKIQLPWPKGLL